MRSRRVGGSSYPSVVQSRRIPLCFINFMYKCSFNSNSAISIDFNPVRPSLHRRRFPRVNQCFWILEFGVGVPKPEEAHVCVTRTRTCTCDLACACMCVCTARLQIDGWLGAPTAHNDGSFSPLLACCERASALRCHVFRGRDRIGWWLRLRLRLVLLYPVLDWTGYHINACGAPLGESFRVPVFFPETRTRVSTWTNEKSRGS